MKINPKRGELPYEVGDVIPAEVTRGRTVKVVAGPWYVVGDFYGYYAVREDGCQRPWILGISSSAIVIDKTVPGENL